MKFIISKKSKYYTKEGLKLLGIAMIGIIVIMSVVIIKYKPAYKVTISGETLGYITQKEELENNIEEYKNTKDGCIAFIDIKEMPSYKLDLVYKSTKTVEEEALNKIKEESTITYKTYAITLDGEEKFEVDSEEEAEKIINEIKEDLIEEVSMDLGIVEKYSTELNLSSEETVLGALNEVKQTKVDEYKAAKAAEAARKKREAAEARANEIAASSSPEAYETLANLSLSQPVSGMISSRYGNRGSGFHSGLDIATSAGTGFTAIAPGTVISAGASGSGYGNLIIVDHGDGIQSYYAHCSAIYVSVGESVDASTTIGAVGMTGNATGPHLHLEIRANGNTLNPQNYLY